MLDGGTGRDRASYASSRQGVDVDLTRKTPEGEEDTQKGGDAQGDVLVSIEDIEGSAWNDTLTGDAGANLLLGNGGNDSLNGGSGKDSLDGGDNRDTLEGGDGDDTLYGGQGPDTLDGGDGNDELHGGIGNDSLIGGMGNDSLEGGAGNDTLYGDDGDNNLYGGSGNDTLEGGDDLDGLQGQDGNDLLIGGAGNDEIIGGAGNDTLVAGNGAVMTSDDRVLYPDMSWTDTFIFREDSGHSVIQDFDLGEGDVLGDVLKFEGEIVRGNLGFDEIDNGKITWNDGDSSVTFEKLSEAQIMKAIAEAIFEERDMNPPVMNTDPGLL
ncbi:MAG: hypothetical protein GDA52_07310 [Rhodobacteraceae bacterium]|nr:hypothetical protein [Paracoccaceae bacterium]